MSEAIIIAVISAISPVLVAIISIISNGLVVKTKIEQLENRLSECKRATEEVFLLKRWVIEDGRIINDLLNRVKKLEDKDDR